MNYLSTIISFLGGGLMTYIITSIIKSVGKTCIQNYQVELYYFSENGANSFVKMKLNTHFVNLSGKDYLISDLKAYLHFNDTAFNLKFSKEPLPPLLMLKAKNIIQEEFELRCLDAKNIILKQDDNYSIEVKFRIGRKKRILKVAKNEFLSVPEKCPYIY